MILRDPVHGLITFEGAAERVLARLLETREVQRLRHVRQLGLTSLVFPGAEHSRFAHAVGAAHVMVRLQARIREVEDCLPPDRRMDEAAAMEGLAAALLHDLGHGPFSHLFEEVSPNARHHEDWTLDIVTDPATDVHRALESLSAGMAERVVELLRGRHRLGYLARAVSGALDVDRADYLLRDSHMTGVRYGLYDLDWLLRALSFGEVRTDAGAEWVLAVEGRKGLPPIEGFFLARHFMFNQVYHHKATRAAEALIRGIFARVGTLARDGVELEALPPAVRAAARGETVTLGDYLQLDDVALLHCFAVWERNAPDPALASLCARLRARQLPKTVPLPDDDARWPGIVAAAQAVVDEARGGDHPPALDAMLDCPSDVPYAEKSGADGLFVSIRHQPIRPLSHHSFLLGELRDKRIRSPRLIFPAALRTPILEAIDALLQ